jgi:nitronate monooxygenase
MWNDTQITKQLGIAYPIVQAPMGSRASSVRLAATVSNAGGLGCFSAHDLPAGDIKTTAAEIRAQTQKPFALHLWVGKEGPATIEREQFIRMLSWFVPYYRELAISAPPLPKAIGED